ncbi:MAG: Fe-S cluster assembly protein SufD [Halofilum sp. (in: g-proteobacteria)]|nr:Fe-S cluster assembly protein SufD [Halofilum sp. (in: g-proteobacteria)]
MSAVDDTAARLIERFQGERPGDATDWVARLRSEGAERFARLGLPHQRIEDWKYTSVKAIAKRDFARPDASQATADAGQIEALRIPGIDAHRLVFVNGHFAAALSDREGAGSGVRVRSLATVLAEEPDSLRGRLGNIAPTDFSGFTALNTAFAEDGAVVEIAADSRAERPIELLFVSTAQEHPVAAHPRIVIAAGHHAEGTIIEHYVGLDDVSNLTNVVTEAALDTGAQIAHYRIQRDTRKGFHIGSVHASQAGDSRLEQHNVNIGGQLVRTDINTALNDEGAETLYNGLYLANGRQHVDTHTRINHNEPNTTSEEAYRGILDGYARGVFNGRVYVAPHAQKTAAYQSNDNLLLSGKAEIDTKPELEIYADDVVCTHGATVGQLDTQALFYLRSRGVDHETARGLLLYAFAEASIERMGLEALREWLQGFVIDELPHAERIQEFV